MINDNKKKKKKDDDNVNSVYHVSHVFMILDVLGITCLPDCSPMNASSQHLMTTCTWKPLNWLMYF